MIFQIKIFRYIKLLLVKKQNVLDLSTLQKFVQVKRNIAQFLKNIAQNSNLYFHFTSYFYFLFSLLLKTQQVRAYLLVNFSIFTKL